MRTTSASQQRSARVATALVVLAIVPGRFATPLARAQQPQTPWTQPSAGQVQQPAGVPSWANDSAANTEFVPPRAVPSPQDQFPSGSPQFAAAPTGRNLITPPSAAVNPANATRSGTPAAGSSPGSSWLATLTSLIFVTTLVVLCAKVGQKYLRGNRSASAARVFDVLAKQPLNNRCTLMLVRCGGRLLVLGESAAGLQTMTEICDADEVQLLVQLCESPDNTAGTSAFLNLLRPAVSAEGTEAEDTHAADATRNLRTALRDASRSADSFADPPLARAGSLHG